MNSLHLARRADVNLKEHDRGSSTCEALVFVHLSDVSLPAIKHYVTDDKSWVTPHDFNDVLRVSLHRKAPL